MPVPGLTEGQPRSGREDTLRRIEFLLEASATLTSSLDYTTTLRNVAPLLHDAGRNDEAAVLLGAVTGVHAGAPAYGDTSRELAELADLLGESLGSDQFTACLQRGRSMKPDQTLAFTKGVIAAGFSAES
jgi:hypothetical protein